MKWQYRTEKINGEGNVVRFKDLERVDDERYPDGFSTYEYIPLDEFGALEWELVSVSFENAGEALAIFKRPIIELKG